MKYISFDGKNFESSYVPLVGNIYKHSGNYSVKDGKIVFEYEEFSVYEDGELSGEVISVDDDVEYDVGIASGTSSKLEGLSVEEKKKMIKEEQAKYDQAMLVEAMQRWNETGSYCRLIVPSNTTSDKFTDYGMLPFIRWHRGIDLGNTETMTLKAMGDLICTDTYGIKLDGSYKSGKDFVLEYNMMDTLNNDELSPKNVEGLGYDEEYMDRITNALSTHYSCDNFDTTFEFSDGQWEWYNADGELINNGKYTESDDYSGLILMYVDEDSKRYAEYASYCPLVFYIADDGNIYYPAFAKVD